MLVHTFNRGLVRGSMFAADKASGAKAGKLPAKGNKVAKKATKGSKAASGEKPVTAADRAKAGEGEPVKLPAQLPVYLRDKVAPSKERDGVKFGLKTGLRVTHFCDHLFIANESIKATDADLNATLVAEFPNRIGKESGQKGVPTLQTIAAYRAYYNGKRHGFNSGPKPGHSSSYNAAGEARVAPSAKPAKGKGKGKPAKAK